MDLRADQSPFVSVYAPDHSVLASSARIDGRAPTVPDGVLDRSAAIGRGHVTWQPTNGVREAVVFQSWSGPAGSGVVVAGAALAPTEHRTQQPLAVTAIAWLAGTTAVTAAAAAGAGAVKRRRS